MTVNSVQGIAPQASLSEVRFFFIPTVASQPNPETGASAVAPDVTLSWGRDGREAGSHDVYLGTDADSLSLAGNVSESSFDTLALDLQLDPAMTSRKSLAPLRIDLGTRGCPWGKQARER